MSTPNPFDQFDPPETPAPRRGGGIDFAAIARGAQELGIDPVDLATAISYETAGTYDPSKYGPTTKWGRHMGLIQFGEPQRAKYGVRPGMTIEEQMPAVVSYLRDAGVQPGMGMLDVYSAINAGGVGRYDASDAAAGGAPGTVRDKVERQMADHRAKATRLFGAQTSANPFDRFDGLPATDFNGLQSRSTSTETPSFSGVRAGFRSTEAGPPVATGLLQLDDFGTVIGDILGGRVGVVDGIGALNSAITPDIVEGARSRGFTLAGKTLRGIANIGEQGGDFMEGILPLSGLTPQQVQNEQQLAPLFSLADSIEGLGRQGEYRGEATLDDVKRDPLSLDTAQFIGEQSVLSVPDMVASIYALPAYVLGRTQEIGERRVQNDGRAGEPGLGDLAAAAPGALAESLLERFATGRLLPGGAIGSNAATRVASQTGLQAGTEAVEETAANLAESVGTKRGVDTGDLADAALSGAIVGGGLGGGVQAAGEAVSTIRQRAAPRGPATPQAQQSAESFLAAPVEAPAAQAAQSAEAQPEAQPAAPIPAPDSEPRVARTEPEVQQQQPAAPAQEEVMQVGPGQDLGGSPVATPAADQQQAAGEMQDAITAPSTDDRQRVYHGSRRSGIDRIQLDRSGTGTGDSNYGFGAYFAGNREGADSIRSSTSAIARMPGGKVADAALSAAKGDRAEAARALRARRGRADERQRAEIDRALETLRVAPNRGMTYQTDIPADSKLMAWDEPIQSQPPRVQQAMVDLGFSDPQMTAGAAYRELAAREGGQRQASDALAAAGIPGHRYKDGRGGYHYVVWSESDIGALSDADAPPAGNSNAPTNGQPSAPVEMTVAQAEQIQAAPAAMPDAPMLEISDDRRNFPDERQAVPERGQGAAPRPAPELEAVGDSPVEKSQRGRGASEDYMRASFTNRRSWSQKAFRDAGLDPDAAELLSIDRQFEAVAKVSAEKYGMKVQKSDKALGRMAVDSATDLYRNAETMASVLGLPAKAIGLGDSLTVLFRDGTPYLGAMYPKGGKVEGVDLPPGAIALPRRSNSFAHEWGHALDLHLVSKYGLAGDNLVSRQIRDQGIDFQPNSSKEAFAKLMNAMFFDGAALAAKVSALQQMADSGTELQQASAKRALQSIARGNSKLRVEGTRYVIGSRDFGESVGGKSSRRYFGDPAEMLARAFEAYVAEKVENAGGDVSVLAKGDHAYLSTDDPRFAQTYPKLDERIKIFAAFDDLFYQLGKEQLIASGVPAANPGNLDAFDPRQWLGDVERPAEYKGIKGALREQADQWSAAREQTRRERARPADPMTRWQRVQNAAMPVVSPIQSAFRVMERRYPKSMAIREMANSLVTDPGAYRVVGRVLEQAIRITGGRNYNQLGNIIERYRLDRLDAGDRQLLRWLLVSAEDATRAPPEIVKAAAELRRFMDTLWYDNQEAGINIGYTKNGYLPRVVDMASVIADPEGFVEAAAEAYKANLSKDESVKPEELDERAEAAARAWHFNLANAPSMNFSSTTPAENYTKHRTLGPEADVLLEKFYVNDPLEVIHRYIGMSAKNVEFAKLFGEKGERLNKLFEQMGSEGVSKEDQLYMQGMVENLLGRAPSMLDKKPRMAAMLNQVNAYGVMSMLGRVLISSIAEPGMAGIRTGSAVNVYRPYWNLFKQAIGSADMKQWREITKAIGLIGDAQADMVVQARLGGTFESTPKTDARLARYFSITGLHALTNAQRVSLMPITHRYLGSLTEQLGGKPAQDKEARALLAELGVKDPEAFARWMDDGRPPSIDDLFDANGRETEQGAVYMTAMSRINEQIVQAPYRFDRPEMANTPIGRFLYGIMSFNLAFWNNVYKRQAKVIARAAEDRGALGVAGYVGGQLAPPVLAYFFTQLLVTAAREALLNPQRWEEWERDDKLNENLALLTASRSFPAGLFDIPIQAYQGLKYQRDLTGVAVGAVPSYFLGNMQKIIQVFQESNSEKTNNAEFAGMQGAYQVVANPLIAHLLTSAPGGRLLDPAYGVALAYGTSAAARDEVASAVVGERDSLVAKRERDARRAAEVESGGRGSARGNVRDGDRQETAR